MVAWNCSRVNGSAPVAHSAPNSTALSTLPCASAVAAMSKPTNRCAAAFTCASNAAASARPSPIAVFSAMAYTRWVDATSVVRSGVTRPRCSARAASISSLASTTSTSPGNGISASTGAAPAACASAAGNNST